jgi:hypothetical protein
MDGILAEQRLMLTYLREPSRSEAFDPCRVMDDLCGDGMSAAMLPWQNGLRMAESDHLVLASGTTDGRCYGVVAASDLATPQEPFLFLDAAYLAPSMRGSQLLHRMLALLMLRIAGESAAPAVIAACVHGPCYTADLHAFAQRFPVAAMFPAAAEAVVIDLGMASLARRIVRVVRPGSRFEAISGSHCARAAQPPAATGCQAPGETLVVIDLTAMQDTVLLDAARRFYRARPRGAMARRSDALAAATTPLRDVSAG